MTESYKLKSKIATAVAFIAAFIVYIGEPGLRQIIPVEYSYFIPILVLLAGYFVTQSTENKRVEVAEKLVHEKYTVNDPTANDILNDEYDDAVGEEDGS